MTTSIKGIIILTAFIVVVSVVTVFIFFRFGGGAESNDQREPDSENGDNDYIIITPDPDFYINQDSNNDSALTVSTDNDGFDLLNSMGVGWNLGNALDSLDNRKRGIVGSLPDGVTAAEFYETYWGNPITTFEMIESVAQMGFGAIRIPVTWTDHMDEDFTISKSWLNRVEQVVNYVLDNNMHAIINVHHDNGSGSWPWLRADPENIDWMKDNFQIVWTQIAEHFREHCDRLIFESFNELLDADSNWGGASRAAHEAVNTLNRVFVETVRNTGGNNSDRFLIVKTYGALVYNNPIYRFRLPEDSAQNRLIVGVHFYGTHGFARQQENIPWTESYTEWDYHRNGGYTVEVITRLRENLVDLGIPVAITEFGASNKNNTTDRINYAVHLIQTAGRYGIIAFWWDDGGNGNAETREDVRNYALFNRFNNTWFFPEIAEAMVKAAS